MKTKNSNSKTIKIIFLILIAALATVAYLYKDSLISLISSNDTGQKVNLSLGKENQTTHVKPNEASVISLIDSNQLEQSLSLEAGAIASSTSISASSIDKISGLPEGVALISGLHIDTDALLVASANITFEIPPGSQDKVITGFAYDDDGQDWHAYPISRSENIATLNISHFSGYGIIAISSDFDDLPEPDSVRAKAEQNIAKIIAEIKSGQFTNTQDGVTDDQYLRITNILRVWFKTGVTKHLNQAQSDDEVIMIAATEFITWLSKVNIYGVDEGLSKEINQGYDLLSSAMKNAIDKSYKKCQEHDATQASRLIKLYILAQALEDRGVQGVNIEDIKQKAYACANFKLRVTTSLIDHSGDECPDTTEKYSGVIPLVMDYDERVISGEGLITGEKQNCGRVCTISSGTLDQVVRVPKTIIDLESDTSNVELLIQLDEWDGVDLVMDCGYEYEGIDIDMHETNYAGWTNILFGKKDINMIDENNFRIVNWEVIGKGEVYARKIVKGEGLMSIADEEITTFELIHSPK